MLGDCGFTATVATENTLDDVLHSSDDLRRDAPVVDASIVPNVSIVVERLVHSMSDSNVELLIFGEAPGDAPSDLFRISAVALPLRVLLASRLGSFASAGCRLGEDGLDLARGGEESTLLTKLLGFTPVGDLIFAPL